ncbi:MAG: MFS transporter [Chloroflexi bacterium]|nr:MFS transporter [Chloroflexota bacterium]MDA1002794.1 MFS transporter [Chloroflexota bacterium]
MHTATVTAIDRRNIALYYAYGFLMDFTIWGAIWIKYLIADRGLELRWILTMELPFWLVVAVSQAPMGALADRLGRRRVLAAGAVAFGLCVLGFGFTTNYWMLFIDYLLWGTAMSMRGGIESALVFDTLKQVGRADEFTRIAGRGFAIRLGSGVIGLLTGGFMAEWMGLAAVIQLGTISPLIAAAIAWAMIEPELERDASPYFAGLKRGLTFAWRNPEVRYTLLIGSVVLTGATGASVLIQPFLIEHDVPTALFGVYQTPLRLASLVAALFAFWISTRTTIGRLIPAACALIVAAYLGLALSDATVAFALFMLPAVIAGLADPIVGAHLNVRIPSQMRATVLSVMPLLFALQLAFFQPALGYFAGEASLRIAFLFTTCYFVVLAPPLVVLWRRAHAHTPAPKDGAPAGRPPPADVAL